MKIPTKKIVQDDAEAFEHLGETYGQYIKALKIFHTQTPEEQQEFIIEFGKDFNALLLTLQIYVSERKGENNGPTI